MTDRRSRFARSTAAAPLVITTRDLTIVETCWNYRWLTRAQLEQLVPLPSVGRSNDRLRKLFDARWLGRLRAGTVGNGLVPVYVAGERAIPHLSAVTGLPESVVRVRLREDADAGAVLLPHDLLVNELRIAFSTALPQVGAELESWYTARECYDAYLPHRALRPDGFFLVSFQGTRFPFFLELDCGTTPLPRWRAKVERYLEYRDGGHYPRRYGLQRFRVLVVAPAPVRLAHLRAETARLTDRAFWFALTPAALADPLGVIWQPLGGVGRRALLDQGGR